MELFNNQKTIETKDKITSVKVSIIVPLFNTEKYIEKCLECLVNQTLKDIEIIVINDGSTDNSITVVERFSNKDDRIIILNQENKLQGAARNLGIKKAKGEYIGFVDSDDWVDSDYFEKLYTLAKQYNSDIALATNVRIGGRKKTKKRISIEKTEFVSDLQDKFNISKALNNPCPTNKIYKASLLYDNNILFPEGVYCEDKLFVAQAIYFANSVVTVPKVNYYYFRRPDSTIHKAAKRSPKLLKDAKNNAKLSVIAFLRDNKININTDKYWAIKRVSRFLGFVLFSIKENLNYERVCLFDIIPIWERKICEI